MRSALAQQPWKPLSSGFAASESFLASRNNRARVAMGALRCLLVLLGVASILNSAWCHRERNRGEHAEALAGAPFSERRLEKMLEKAILKIITGDLSAGDMLLLKSLNYSLEEVLAIRERELGKRKDEEMRRRSSLERKTRYWDQKRGSKKSKRVGQEFYKDFDFEAYNRQAILDYENLDLQKSWSEASEEVQKGNEAVDVVRREFDKAMEPHVVFKIRYDDSEFDSSSGSDETSKNRPKYHVRPTTSRNAGNSFHTSTLPPTVATTLPLVYQLSNSHVATTSATPNESTERSRTEENRGQLEGKASTDAVAKAENSTVEIEASTEKSKRINEYEGLEWVEDDVYRVIPQFIDSLDFESAEENETSDYEDSRPDWTREDLENDTSEYQNDAPESVKLFMANSNASASNLPLANLSTYLQAAIAHRRGGNVSSSFDSQGEKAIEDIKSRVLALTGRFNVTTDANQVQRERLTMFSPSCQVPRNTDQEAWSDQFSMNMHFQLNLTSGEHVVAAKLRIFKLPQENATASSESTFDEDEEDEKKIRISVYYYTKSLKRHRSKKRLMDSVVTPLTSRGTHLALDVRQGLRFWRPNPRNAHGSGSNHGLVVQVEDQDGRPLKPALYIQQPSCSNQDSDQKTTDYLHSSYEPVLVTFAS